MSSRTEGRGQAQASARADISERSGRRIERGEVGVQSAKRRHWRTRSDPFVEVWSSEIEPLLEKQPALDATTLFEDLQDRHPGRFPNGQKRTFQRRVKVWKALHGPGKDVMFRQEQVPGRLGLSDFTEPKGIVVTIGGEALSHRLYHFRLAYSGWSHVRVILGGNPTAPWPRAYRGRCGVWAAHLPSTVPTVCRRRTATSTRMRAPT